MSEISRDRSGSSGRRRAAPYMRVSASQQEAYSLDEQRDALLPQRSPATTWSVGMRIPAATPRRANSSPSPGCVSAWRLAPVMPWSRLICIGGAVTG